MKQSINFDEGIKEYLINNDPERVIRVNTADYAIIGRFKSVEERLNEKMAKYKDVKINADGTAADMNDEEAVAAIDDLSNIVKEEINYIFNADVADIVFNGTSPISTRKGVPLYERFTNAMFPIIKADIEAESEESSKRIEKYTKKANQVKGYKSK